MLFSEQHSVSAVLVWLRLRQGQLNNRKHKVTLTHACVAESCNCEIGIHNCMINLCNIFSYVTETSFYTGEKRVLIQILVIERNILGARVSVPVIKCSFYIYYFLYIFYIAFNSPKFPNQHTYAMYCGSQRLRQGNVNKRVGSKSFFHLGGEGGGMWLYTCLFHCFRGVRTRPNISIQFAKLQAINNGPLDALELDHCLLSSFWKGLQYHSIIL